MTDANNLILKRLNRMAGRVTASLARIDETTRRIEIRLGTVEAFEKQMQQEKGPDG